MSANHTDDEIVPLSNYEIENLYDIARQAQDLPETSSRALFDAYDAVLASKGINAEDDTVMHRFLLRMQQNEEEPSFVKRFQHLLADMNIHVDVDSEGEGVEVTSIVEDTTRNGGHSSQKAIRIPSRRGSFDSFFDGTADKVAGTENLREIPLRARRGSRDAVSDTGGLREKRRSRSDSASRGLFFNQLPMSNGINANINGNRRSASDQGNPPPHRRSPVSTKGSIKITRNGDTNRHLGDYDGGESEQTDYTNSFDASNIRIPGVNAPIPGVDDHDQQHQILEPYRLSNTQMIDDAETFEHRRIYTVARRCLQKWLDSTRELIEKAQELEDQASAVDRRALLKQSLSSWQIALQAKRQDAETEHFFGRLETRADKARNLFLLTKAFTHWAQSAEDEVQRTSVARRHILRTRYFKQWHRITAVNDFKIQQFVLGRFLNKWRARTAAVQQKAHLAVGLYEENLIIKTQRRMLINMWETKASNISNGRLQRKMFEQWNEITHLLKDRENWALNRRDREVLRRALESWRQREATLRSQEEDAQAFRRTKLMSIVLSAVRQEAQFAPLLAQFTARADFRVVQTAFHTWHRNFQYSRHAQTVDRTRILRTAFTAWNDRLRTNQVVERINDRVLVEAMYKWALASRVSLFRRVQDRKLKESAMTTWIARTQERNNTLESAERRFAQFKRTQMLQSCLRRIESATVAKKGQEFIADSMYEPKLKAKTFDKLREKLAHLQELQEWSRTARFYVLTTHMLKTWNEATQQSRRNRRRETYTQMRRTVKMNLVRRTFAIWRDKAAQVTIANRQAEEIAENRVLHSSTALLGHWRDRTVHLRDLDAQAAQKLNTRLASSSLSTWTERFQEIQTQNVKAMAFRQETVELAAGSYLKKMGWRLFNLTRQEENALALHQRNFEKHLRAMIRFWFEQTMERAAQRPVSPTPSSRHRGGQSRRDDDDYDNGDDERGNGEQGRRRGEDDGGSARGGNADFDAASRSSHSSIHGGDVDNNDTRRLEAWTAFDEDALGLSNNLDLALSISPQRHANPSSSRKQIRPQSTLKSRPTPILEDVEEDDPFALDNETPFWASTPMPPTLLKPGYLKTPSKRSVVRGKRPELPPSPEKQDRLGLLQRAAMSAPPGILRRDTDTRGVTSFERRLREGGVGVAGGVSGRAKGKGRPRVGFGDVSHLE
ncbi:Sfi1-domain-containing protein [Pleomassaria siparia CBS 279.74]|uniref:Sfi1-domain-containing protein n=1 Tax=Pleomassaria siparia CBS 279.74 TaxID=1314801 RepID=A0A6G1KK71_9PLEO|nr:Sfi1-domain-containing protein [Pleomassaria siparia CBS 279.74]